MSFPSFVSFRYLTSNRKNLFLSWISLLSILGITISVATMIVVLSVINGFEIELEKRFLNANAHILAYRFPAGMKNPEKWAEIFKKDFGKYIKSIAPFVHYETMARKGAILQSILVRGISPDKREKVQSIKKMVTPSSSLNILQKEINDAKAGLAPPKVPSIIIGKGLATVLNAKIGDIIRLISPTAKDITSMKPFKIVGLYECGLKHYDNRLTAMSLTTAQNFFHMDHKVTGLEIGLFKPSQSPHIADLMADKYSLTIKEWQSFNKSLFEAIQTEKVVIFAIIFFVAIVAGFNILTTLFVAATQKQRDISILKALGANNWQILSIFLNQGIYIGIIGGVFGMLLALGINLLLDNYEFIKLPDPYFLSTLPVTYDPAVYFTIGFIGVFICVIAGLYPAFLAAKVPPTEGIKGTGDIF